MYLLDTNVVSELRRQKPHGAVLSWFKSIGAADVFLSAMTLGEIQRGVENLRTKDPAKTKAIDEWANDIVATHEIIPIGTDIIRLWAKLMDGKPDDAYEDMMIAATAAVHSLFLVTRNTKYFQGFGITIINPFEFTQNI